MRNILYEVDESATVNPTYPKEATKQKKLKFKDNKSRFSTGAANVDPLSQFKASDMEQGHNEEEEEEEEHQIFLEENHPGYDGDKQVLY